MPDKHQDAVSDRLSVRILGWGRFEIGPTWNAADVCSTYWRLYVNNRSGASVRLADERYDISPGAVHFLPPWVRFSCICRERVGHFYIHFDTIGLPGVVIRDLFDRPFALSLTESLGAAIASFDGANGAGHNGLAVQLRLKSMIYGELSRLIQSLPAEKLARCQLVVGGEHPVQTVLRHIDHHLAESISNEELANLCHCSVDHFIRVFRELVGQPPAQYIIERRVGRAAQLLVFSKASIEQIAEETGFANRFYFSRVFKQRMGESPAAYRKTTRV